MDGSCGGWVSQFLETRYVGVAMCEILVGSFKMWELWCMEIAV